MRDEFLRELSSHLPGDALTREATELAHWGSDWSGILKPAPLAIAFPGSTEAVSRILKLCSRYKIAVVPSGGRTGLSGGAVALSGELVLSLSRMRKMGTVSEASRTVWVEAGAVTEAVHRHCEPHGLTWPVEFASQGSSTVGGNLATNAGGVRVLRYGNTRNWVLGLTAVLASGEVVCLNGALEKNNTGFDLRHLLIGSEGVLAVITEAILKLSPVLPAQETILFRADGFASVLRLFAVARREPELRLTAFETWSEPCRREVERGLGFRDPFAAEPGALVLLEADSPLSEECMERLLAVPGILDAAMARSGAERAHFWKLREGIAEAVMKGGLVHQEDLSVPIDSLGPFYEGIEARTKSAFREAEVFLFGHIGDGNLHVFIRKPETVSLPAFKAQAYAADQKLFELVRELGGSVSAEHGVGLLKKPALAFSRSTEEIRLFQSIKRAFDPQGILNPGKIID